MGGRMHIWVYCHTDIAEVNGSVVLDGDETNEIMYTAFDSALVVGIMPALFIAGLVTNLSFLCVVVRVPHMRTVTNFHLLQLALADVLLLSSAVGEKLWYYSASPIEMDTSILGPAGCIWSFVLKKFFFWVSTLLVTFLNYDKFHAVCWPLKHRQAHCKSKIRRSVEVCGVWTVGACMSLPTIPSNNRYVSLSIKVPEGFLGDNAETGETLDMAVCCPENPTAELVILVILGTFFVACLVTNVVMSIGTIRAINRSSAAAKSKNTIIPKRRLQGRNLVARMLVVNGAVYFLLMIPRHCYSISQVAHLDLLDENQRRIILNLTRILLYLNSVINPVIYIAVNSRYRKAFKLVFWPASRTSIRPIAWK